MKKSADKASVFLKSLGHPHRLMIVCRLMEGEHSVGELANFLELRDSTVSQHLSLLRKDGIVSTRREGQTIWYSLSSPAAGQMIAILYRTFCSEGYQKENKRKKKS